jgi:iron complex transport system permease protein
LNYQLGLLSFSLLIVCMVAVASMSAGAVAIPVWHTFQWTMTGDASGLTDSQQTILWQLRFPRIVAACCVGASLAIAGVGFQGLFRNPLADPYVVGASSGAALGASLAVVTSLKLTLLGLGVSVVAPMIGSIGVVLLVFLIGSLGRQSGPMSLLLAGIAVSSMVNALVSLLMFLNDQKAIVILSWLMGSLAGAEWRIVVVSILVTVLGVTYLWCQARKMDAFLLGDTTSQSLGLSLFQFRLGLIVAGSLLTATAVGTAGIIGFVGLIAPQIARMLIGPKHVWLVPMSGCVGAMVMLFADAVARTVVAPAELPVGIVTALLGCPFFLALLLTRKC